eukprot:SAG11_NODE_5711_length_1481_cov_1.559334_2_plen_172_part_00
MCRLMALFCIAGESRLPKLQEYFQFVVRNCLGRPGAHLLPFLSGSTSCIRAQRCSASTHRARINRLQATFKGRGFFYLLCVYSPSHSSKVTARNLLLQLYTCCIYRCQYASIPVSNPHMHARTHARFGLTDFLRSDFHDSVGAYCIGIPTFGTATMALACASSPAPIPSIL